MSDYEKMKEIYDEIDKLIAARVTSSSPQFTAWRVKTKLFLIDKYGEKSLQYKEFNNKDFSLLVYTSFTQPSEEVEACRDGLLSSKAVFEVYLSQMQEETDEVEKYEVVEEKDFSKVFIVYGHDKELWLETARIIERQGIEAIILSEQVSRGNTIIEQLEKYSNVPAAVCLFTADDLGREKTEKDERKRARQNVVFETGMVMGKIGRENVIVYSENEIEMPSDLHGVVYKGKDNWELRLLRELKAIGYDIDATVLI